MTSRTFGFRIAIVATLLLALASAAAGKSGVPLAGARVVLATAADQKLDAPLRMTIERYTELAAAARAGRAAAPSGGPLFDRALPFGQLRPGAGGEPALDVFVKLSNGGTSAGLTSRGGRILLDEGDLVLARLPISSIAPLAGSADVQAMSISRAWATTLDSSLTRTGVRAVHQGGNGTLPQPYTGAGVFVGVLDSGLDYTHPDFRASAGSSRVAALFDFSQGTDGAECRPGQLDSLTCPEIDGTGGHGHGTHVTGIAAGNGRLNPKYVGMAPQADLLFVKGMRDPQSNGGFQDADIVQGVAWMLDRAITAGEPIAVNLSLGGQLGAHDGTSIQEQFLDSFSGPGRIIVAAAGNSGGEPIHVSYAVTGDSYQTALETGLLMTSPVDGVDMWAPAGSNFSVGVAGYAPGDLTQPGYVSTAAAPGQQVQQTVTAGTQLLATITIDARTTADPNNGARNILVSVELGPGIQPNQFIWTIYTFGSGTFDMWQYTGSFFFPPGFSPNPSPPPPWFRAGDDNKTIGIPATAKRLLCVGSHVSKTRWTDVNDTVRVEPNATLDQISVFSSHGPSRDGRVLPNLTAPGEVIVSALSSGYPADSSNIVQGGGYQRQQGTSQASPHITGIAALMLQRDPALTPENVRDILQFTATAAGTGNPNNTYGRGRVNALAALRATPDPLGCTIQLPNGDVIACDRAASLPTALMAYPNPARASVRFSLTTPTRAAMDLAIYDIQGRRVKTLLRGPVGPGVHSADWNGDDEHGRRMPGGVYFARLLAPSVNRTLRLVLRP